VFKIEGKETNDETSLLLEMNEYLNESIDYDIPFYSSTSFSSVHIGTFLTTSTPSLQPPSPPLSLAILMPVYNTKPSHLSESLSSIFSQTILTNSPNTDLTIFIIDDGSTSQETQDFIDELIEQDERVEVVSYQPNMGVAAALKIGMDVIGKSEKQF
jgi:hypothetical protein